MAHGYRHLVVEGDCQGLIGKLKSKSIPDNSLGYFVSDILSSTVNLDFIAWSFVERGCNKVAHAIATSNLSIIITGYGRREGQIVSIVWLLMICVRLLIEQ